MAGARPIELPVALRGVFFDFCWETARLWHLPTPISSCPADDLLWHLDLPIWSTDPPRPLFDLAPRTVLAAPDSFVQHTRRIAAANPRVALDLFEHRGRWVIMDGYHRLAHHGLIGSSCIPVRLHPPEYLQLVRTDVARDAG